MRKPISILFLSALVALSCNMSVDTSSDLDPRIFLAGEYFYETATEVEAGTVLNNHFSNENPRGHWFYIQLAQDDFLDVELYQETSHTGDEQEGNLDLHVYTEDQGRYKDVASSINWDDAASDGVRVRAERTGMYFIWVQDANRYRAVHWGNETLTEKDYRLTVRVCSPDAHEMNETPDQASELDMSGLPSLELAGLRICTGAYMDGRTADLLVSGHPSDDDYYRLVNLPAGSFVDVEIARTSQSRFDDYDRRPALAMGLDDEPQPGMSGYAYVSAIDETKKTRAAINGTELYVRIYPTGNISWDHQLDYSLRFNVLEKITETHESTERLEIPDDGSVVQSVITVDDQVDASLILNRRVEVEVQGWYGDVDLLVKYEDESEQIAFSGGAPPWNQSYKFEATLRDSFEGKGIQGTWTLEAVDAFADGGATTAAILGWRIVTTYIDE